MSGESTIIGAGRMKDWPPKESAKALMIRSPPVGMSVRSRLPLSMTTEAPRLRLSPRAFAHLKTVLLQETAIVLFSATRCARKRAAASPIADLIASSELSTADTTTASLRPKRLSSSASLPSMLRSRGELIVMVTIPSSSAFLRMRPTDCLEISSLREISCWVIPSRK